MQKLTKKEFIKSLSNSYFIASIDKDNYKDKNIKKELSQTNIKELKENAIYQVNTIKARSNSIITNGDIYRDFNGKNKFYQFKNFLLHYTNDNLLLVNIK